ncbi:sensor histidine kinase [Dyadobacter arcticus]|uniref:Sensor histidine kinase YesM n=1 Tax=Dyadobacter arcticus TaxID=1078754 RepID=A0ABX0ULE8_9BACT|nr:histidine kinase [Dyadobacter arcticus]NIJ53786.1 sensor histidine kinase YesM [Dyadobacter arcticus]
MIQKTPLTKSIGRLTASQKWRLGFGFALIYLPIRIYMNVLSIGLYDALHKLPLWAIELIVSVSLFTLWIHVIEWLQQYVSGFFGEEFVDDFRFINQLFTLIIAFGMAVMFNAGFRILWHFLEAVWENQPFEFTPVVMDDARLHRRRANTAITVMALMGAYYLAANKRANQKLQQVHLNEERLEKENIKAHFSALKNQVSPHFLFNNFSVLSTLIETNPEQSVEFVNRLSKAYRYILEQSDFELIKLRTEIEFLETYMFLLKTRFEDKIRLDIQIPSNEIDHYSIVPLSLQLLIENAVKHNQMSSSNPLVITIHRDDDFLFVSNPIRARQLPEPSTRLGLQNIIERYKLLINKPVSILSEHSQFVVKIPLIR